MIKSQATVGLLFLFLLSSFVLPAFAPAVVTAPAVSAASGGASSCTAADSVKAVLAGGTPDSYASQATVSSHTGAIIGQMDFLGIYPWDVPLGTLYNQSLVDWVSHNANYTQWNVNIRPGLKWSNGQPVTSADIVATYSSSFGLNPSVDINDLRSYVTGVVPDNTSEVTFNLNKSSADFLITAGAATYTNVMPAAYDNLNFTGEGINETVVGPYYPYNGQPGSTQLTMYRNPYFYTTGVPEPAPCALDISFVEATSNVEDSMLSNTFDFGYVVDPGQVQALTQDANLRIFDQPAAAVTSIIWNATQFPFNYTQFRQAIAYSINYNEIVNSSFGGYGSSGANAQGEIPTTLAKYYDPNQQSYNTSATEATTLLSQIGIKSVGGQMQWPNGQPVTFTLFADSSYATDLLAANVIEQGLASLGITISVQSISHTALSQYNHNMPPGDAFLSYGGGVDYPSATIDATPGCSIFSHPHDCSYNATGYYTEVAQNAFNTAFNSNLTALTATADPTAIHTYLDNIQSLNAKYLPYLIVGYNDELGVYSNQRWVGWQNGLTYPSGWFQSFAGRTNTALWSDISLAGSTASASSSGTQTSTSATQTSTSATGSTSMTTSMTSSSTTTTTTTNNNTLYYAIAAIVVIVVVALGLMFARRGRGTPATPA